MSENPESMEELLALWRRRADNAREGDLPHFATFFDMLIKELEGVLPDDPRDVDDWDGAAMGRPEISDGGPSDWVYDKDYPTEKARFCNQAGPMGGGCKDSWHVGGNYGSNVCRNPNHHDN